MGLSTISAEFISKAIFRIEENVSRIVKCMNELSEEEIWMKSNQSSNSAGNLILHICGNVTQYIISGLGSREDLRQRDKEFSTIKGYNRDELINKLSETINESVKIIRNLSEEELLRARTVQGNEHTGVSILIHVTEHFSYHTGQIAFWTKMIKNKDLGFYRGINLNKK